MSSIFREDNETIRQIMECSIAYTKFVESGGCVCTFTSTMTDQVIDLAMRLKAHRDYIAKYCGREIPTYDKDGNRKEKRLRHRIPETEYSANTLRA